jgi:hypothetical protein
VAVPSSVMEKDPLADREGLRVTVGSVVRDFDIESVNVCVSVTVKVSSNVSDGVPFESDWDVDVLADVSNDGVNVGVPDSENDVV